MPPASLHRPLLLNVMCALAVTCAAEEPRRPEQLPDSHVPQAPKDDSLYRELGSDAGINALVRSFRERLLADARFQPYFQDVDERRFREKLAEQLCEVSGGPCRQSVYNMRRVHSGVDISRATFDALVEVLQQTMDAQGISFRTQNRLLAQLAPMHRDIVNMH